MEVDNMVNIGDPFEKTNLLIPNEENDGENHFTMEPFDFYCQTRGTEGVINEYPAGERCPNPQCRRAFGKLPNECLFTIGRKCKICSRIIPRGNEEEHLCSSNPKSVLPPGEVCI